MDDYKEVYQFIASGKYPSGYNKNKKESFGENAKRTFISRVVFSTMPRKLHRAKRANGGKFLVVERIFGESLILAIHL